MTTVVKSRPALHFLQRASLQRASLQRASPSPPHDTRATSFPTGALTTWVEMIEMPAQQLERSSPATPLFLILIGIILGSAQGCKGSVARHERGGEIDERLCADRPDHENNCMACSALPECGWCESPSRGRAHCQLVTDKDRPASCRAEFAKKSEDCRAPPPPPPSTPPPSGPPSELGQASEAPFAHCRQVSWMK
jgi:hypothetical protein